jgi:hypothetical protein
MSRARRRTISGRTVVIMGAASGIGRALAQWLSAHGCAVAIADVDEKGLKETAPPGMGRRWRARYGPTLARVRSSGRHQYQHRPQRPVPQGPEGRRRTHEQMVAEFAAITMTQPDKAAEVIHRGVEAGKARILVGPDAYLFDALARLAPTHYYDILSCFETVLRRRSRWAFRAFEKHRVVRADDEEIGFPAVVQLSEASMIVPDAFSLVCDK